MAMPRHFGILIPSTNTTCEIEFCRLAPDLQVHTARLGKDGNTPFSPSLDADVAYQAKLLGHARVEVIALAQTSASLFADDYDTVTVKRMAEASGVPCLTSAQAIGRALKALKASRIAMAIRDAFKAFSARPIACAEVRQGTPDASAMRFTVTVS